MQGGLGGGVYPESYMRDSARGAIRKEVVPTRCRGTAALNQSADETRTPASQCLPAMPLPRLPGGSECRLLPLELGLLAGSAKGWQG
jgi:hypothetical protein